MTVCQAAIFEEVGTVYGLCEPDSGVLRYVGKTDGELRKRIREHLCRARRGSHAGRVYDWLRSLDAEPLVQVLGEAPPGQETSDLERFWIASVRAAGGTLVNHTDGGEGVGGYKHTAKDRRRMSKINKKNNRKSRPERWALSPNRAAQACEMYIQGKSCRTIAEELGGITDGGVRKELIRRGVRRRSSGAGSVLSSRMAGVSRLCLSSDQQVQAEAGYRSGSSCMTLGRLFGVSEGTIRNVLKRRGVERRSAGAGRWLTERAKNAD